VDSELRELQRAVVEDPSYVNAARLAAALER
jgi:hypothetical protein